MFRQTDEEMLLTTQIDVLDVFVWGRECRNEVNFINLKCGSDGLGGGEMSVMDGIKCSTQYGNLHVRRDSSLSANFKP